MPEKIDELSGEEVQLFRSKLELDKSIRAAAGGGDGGRGPQKVPLVAQGDSWFDYPPGLDLIYWLEKDHGYEIENFASAGDTLENMVYGTKFSKSNWRRYPCRMNDVVESVSKIRPKGVLFSAVGNDLAGDALDSYYNHATSGLANIRQKYMDYMFDDFFFQGYSDFIAKVCAALGKTPGEAGGPIVFSHTYANAIPDGRAVLNVAGFRFFGPWLRPTFTRKDITDLSATIVLVQKLIAKFAAMLERVKQTFPDNFDYVDFRPLVNGQDDWSNELHLKNSVYRKCAEALAQKLKSKGI